MATFADSSEDRLRSYELLVEIFELNQGSKTLPSKHSPVIP
jgi:hypothetical protein